MDKNTLSKLEAIDALHKSGSISDREFELLRERLVLAFTRGGSQVEAQELPTQDSVPAPRWTNSLGRRWLKSDYRWQLAAGSALSLVAIVSTTIAIHSYTMMSHQRNPASFSQPASMGVPIPDLYSKSEMRTKALSPVMNEARDMLARGEFWSARTLCEDYLKTDRRNAEAKKILKQSMAALARLAKAEYTEGLIFESMDRIGPAKEHWSQAKQYVRVGDPTYEKIISKLEHYK